MNDLQPIKSKLLTTLARPKKQRCVCAAAVVGAPSVFLHISARLHFTCPGEGGGVGGHLQGWFAPCSFHFRKKKTQIAPDKYKSANGIGFTYNESLKQSKVPQRSLLDFQRTRFAERRKMPGQRGAKNRNYILNFPRLFFQTFI